MVGADNRRDVAVYYFLMYMGILPVCISVYAVEIGTRRVLDIPELELQTVVILHVGAGKRTRVLYKSSQCS